MSIYTRVTVAGAHARAEVVVPSDESLGSALPRLLDLLGETEGTVARPLTLVTPDGEQLDIARTPTQLDLLDGTLLRLERLEAAPPSPVVIDVTDAAADAHDDRPDRWDARARALAAGIGIASAVGGGALLLPLPGEAAAVTQIAAFAVLLAASAGLGLGGLRRVSAAVGAAAAGLAAVLAILAATLTSDLLLGAAVALATTATTVLVAIGVARRAPGALAGGALGAVLGTLLLVLLLTGVSDPAAAAITGVVAAFATGPLPWIALSAAGLTTLDAQAAAGERIGRGRAFSAIDDAYAALTWSVLAVAFALAITGVALVLADALWPGLVALAIAVVAALRFRAFPLRAQGWALWAAVGAIALTAFLTQLAALGWIAPAVGVAVAAVIAAASIVSPRPAARARLRGLGNILETLAVVSLLPLLLGALGVYDELLGMFGGGA